MQKPPDKKQLQENLSELKSMENTLKEEIILCQQANTCDQVQLERLKKQLSTLELSLIHI